MLKHQQVVVVEAGVHKSSSLSFKLLAVYKKNKVKEMVKRASSLSSISFLILILVLIFAIIDMADSAPNSSSGSSSPKSAVHIVYTERPQQNEEPEAYHIRTLASVLGGEEAAKEALIYSYKTAASGFSAKLTPQQVVEISKQPGVLQVVPSRTVQLHSGSGIGQLNSLGIKKLH